jgi:tetratricopeptide (TPR) repeat protein
MRGALILLLLAVTTVAAAPRTTGKKPLRTTEETAKPAAKTAKPAAKPADAPKPRPPGPEDAKAVAILERIVAGPDTAARKPAIAELTEIAPRTIDAIGEWLARPHASDVAERRAVLAEIKASVPDEKGTFSQPPRQTGKQQKADDELDWQAALLALDPRQAPSPEPSQDPSPAPTLAAVGEVIADDAAIRALAATGDRHAAQVIFDTAFGADTMIYRDECGRYLRKMEPASIPALIRESMAKRYDRKRYATWQLERLDRQEPDKALDAALGDEALMIAILDVFRTTHHREAVHAVWKRIDADAPRVRAAARAAWLAYITGPPPPPAPVAKLNLPGGKKTKKPKPLWLTYRELADTELRKAANELLHEDYPLDDPTLDDSDDGYEKKIVKIDLQALTMRLLGYYDAERAKQETAQWSAAKGKAESGDLAAATQMVDRMLAINPDRSERAEMAKLYLAWGKQLEEKQQWGDAAAAYSKAHGLDPRGASAGDALAAHHYTLGKSLEAQGKDGSPDYRRAIALKPDYAPARSAAKEAAAAGRPIWMLYAAAAAAAVALLLFAAAMIRRRA